MIRSFRSTQIDRRRIDALLKLALAGPSAGNAQSLQFVALDGDEVGTYWETTLPVADRDRFPWPGLLRAPVLVIPYVEPERYLERYREPDKAHTGLGREIDSWTVPYWWVDGGAAVQTLLLAVAADGLGACFFGQFEHEGPIRRLLGVPDTMRALGTVAIGHPDEHDRPSRSARRPRRSPSETIRWSGWDASTQVPT